MTNDCGEQFLPARKRLRGVTLMRLEPVGRLEMQYDPTRLGCGHLVRKEARDLVLAAAGWLDRGCRDPSSGPTTPVAGKTAYGIRTAMDSSQTDDEAKVVFSLQGYSIDEATASLRRAIVAAMWLGAQEERYRWLHYHLCVGEAEVDEETEL